MTSRAVLAGLLLLLFGCGPAGAPLAARSPVPPAKSRVLPPLTGAQPLIQDLTWVSGSTGWALAGTSIYRTVDGGAHWLSIAAAPPGVQHVRFATSSIGYAYGPGLYLSRDGGLSWQRQASPPVEDLEPAGGVVYRVVYDHLGCPGPCNRTLQAANTGSASWLDLLAIARSDIPGAALRAQVISSIDNLYVAVHGNPAAGAGTAQTVTFRSLDGGATWQRLGDPCGRDARGENYAAGLAAAGSTLFALCQSRSNTPGAFLLRSGDGGTSWGARLNLPDPQLGLIAAASGSVIAVASPEVIGSGPFVFHLWASADGGASWVGSVSATAVLAPAGAAGGWLGFEDARDGRWVGSPDAIWATADGGRTWRRSAFP